MSDKKTENVAQVQSEKEVRTDRLSRPTKRGIKTGIKAGQVDYVCW